MTQQPSLEDLFETNSNQLIANLNGPEEEEPGEPAIYLEYYTSHLEPLVQKIRTEMEARISLREIDLQMATAVSAKLSRSVIGRLRAQKLQARGAFLIAQGDLSDAERAYRELIEDLQRRAPKQS